MLCVDSRAPVFPRRHTRCTAAVVSSPGASHRNPPQPPALAGQVLCQVVPGARSCYPASRTSTCRTPTTRPPRRPPPTIYAASRTRRTRGRCSSVSSDSARRRRPASACHSWRCGLPAAAAAEAACQGLAVALHDRVGSAS